MLSETPSTAARSPAGHLPAAVHATGAGLSAPRPLVRARYVSHRTMADRGGWNVGFVGGVPWNSRQQRRAAQCRPQPARHTGNPDAQPHQSVDVLELGKRNSARRPARRSPNRPSLRCSGARDGARRQPPWAARGQEGCGRRSGGGAWRVARGNRAEHAVRLTRVQTSVVSRLQPVFFATSLASSSGVQRRAPTSWHSWWAWKNGTLPAHW